MTAKPYKTGHAAINKAKATLYQRTKQLKNICDGFAVLIARKQRTRALFSTFSFPDNIKRSDKNDTVPHVTVVSWRSATGIGGPVTSLSPRALIGTAPTDDMAII